MTNPFIQVSIFKSRTKGEINFKRCRLFLNFASRLVFTTRSISCDCENFDCYFKFTQIGGIALVALYYVAIVCSKGKLFICVTKKCKFPSDEEISTA
jgi:hypothetical protein